jgi:hypothetical protein
MLNKVRPGESISAARWNEMIDAVSAASSIATDGSLCALRTPGGTLLSLTPRAVGIPFKNNFAGTIKPFEVFSGAGISTSWGGPAAVLADRPSTTFRRTYYVNGDTEVRQGEYGLAQLGPVVTVAYDTGTPALGEGWGPKPSQFTLSKNYPHIATVLGIVDGTKKWMLAQWNQLDRLIGKTNATHNKNASGTINLYQGAAGSEALISSLTVSAFNKFANVASGKWVVVEWINGQWYLTSAEC